MQITSDTEWQGGFWADGGAHSEVLLISITSTFTSGPGCKLGFPKHLLFHLLMELNSNSYSWCLACIFHSVLIFSWAHLLTFSLPYRLGILRSSLLSKPLIFCPVHTKLSKVLFLSQAIESFCFGFHSSMLELLAWVMVDYPLGESWKLAIAEAIRRLEDVYSWEGRVLHKETLSFLCPVAQQI